MKIKWTCLCVLVAFVPRDAAATPVAKREQGHVALLGNIPIQQEKPEYAALKGHGGGLKTLQAMEEGEKEPVYRPWKSRYELRPYDLNNPDFLKPENRIAYRNFYAANPNLSLGPNSRDRQAETTVEMMFGLTALGTIIGGILIVNGMQVLDTDNLEMDDYHKLMMRVIMFAAVPWLVLGVWLLTVFGASVANPMRDPAMVYHWQCSAMSWFLLVAPLVNAAYFTVHALWVSRLFFSMERQSTATMGRMFSLSTELQKQPSADSINRALNIATGSIPRHVLLCLEAMCAGFGYMLITFRGGANSQFCQPEVYWATTALVITVAVIIVFSALTFCLSILIGVYSTSPWVQDFAGSFWENRLLAKAANLEEKERQDAAGWKAQQALARSQTVEEKDTEWDDFQQDFAEDRERHQAIMAEHNMYEEAINQAPPPRYEVETVLPSTLAAMNNDREDEPLVLWGDDESEVPGTMRPSFQEPTTMAGNMTSMNPSMVSARLAAASATFPPGTRPLSVNRITTSAGVQILGSEQEQVTGSLAALNAQVDSNPNERWGSQGFAMPFAQRPNSAPVLPTSSAFVTASGRMPTTASTIYTEQPRAPFGNSV